jgi:branched-chain amino acid transport system ATP-binding protein
MSVETTLTVDRLTTGYLHAPALRDITLEVGPEIVAVLGANGAGKTTLLRAIAGNLRAWSGTVALGGRNVGTSSPWQRAAAGIAHVPEGRHAFGAMTVRENLDVAGLVGRRRGGARTRDDVYDLFPRLGERRDQPAGSLSGGEQQMLVIGRALMTSPRVLLIDELSAGLAPVTARLLVESLDRIHRDLGVAMLLVEQSPNLVADVIDRVYVLDRGTITRQGTVDSIGGAEGLAAVYLAAAAG